MPPRVIYTEYLGDNAFVYARLANGTQVSIRTNPSEHFAPDEMVTITIEPQAAHFFSAETGQRLAV